MSLRFDCGLHSYVFTRWQSQAIKRFLAVDSLHQRKCCSRFSIDFTRIRHPLTIKVVETILSVYDGGKRLSTEKKLCSPASSISQLVYLWPHSSELKQLNQLCFNALQLLWFSCIPSLIVLYRSLSLLCSVALSRAPRSRIVVPTAFGDLFTFVNKKTENLVLVAAH